MSNLALFLLMMCGGTAVALQPSINARLAQKIGVIESSFVSFTVGALVLAVAVSFWGRGSLRALSTASWWELTGGLLGAAFVTLTIVVVPRIGTAAAMAAIIAAQLTTGLLMDHLGLFGFRGAPLDGKRIAGTLLLMAGAALVFRR
ncbi:DMT family transporter [Geobacter grbiciae]|uniref:DMT family transporter n=1 Tax=Geobacter grbiciae TaxID=155042 RepID=UPI001C009D13|nr:DMT family transporter [Geobacter grbiciae]MBT1075643.1 DMT family transporter [Geobacter grbiciae]